MTPGKQPGPATPERLAEFYAADLAEGRVPVQAADQAGLAGRLRDRQRPSRPPGGGDGRYLTRAPRPGANRQEEPPGRGHRLAPGRRPVIPHRIRRGRRSRVSGGFVASAVAAGVRLALLPATQPRHTPAGQARQRTARRHGDRLRPAAARQALPVGRHRPGRVRLLGPGHAGIRGGRDRHRADLAGAVGDRAAGQRPRSRETWCSSPGRTARPPRRATWGSWSTPPGI